MLCQQAYDASVFIKSDAAHTAVLLTVGAAERQVAVNTTLTDVNAFLDHIVSSTNMRRVPSVPRVISLSQGFYMDCA